MNKWIGIGNLARDPELSSTQSGISYCRFTIACQRRFANQQGVREADFINCVAWRQTAEFVNKYFTKGSKIAVEGTIQTRSYDGQDGQKHYVTEAIIDSVEFAGSRSDGSGQSAQPAQPTGGQPNRNPNGTIPGIMQPPRNQQQRMDLNAQQNNDFMEVDDDELPF